MLQCKLKQNTFYNIRMFKETSDSLMIGGYFQHLFIKIFQVDIDKALRIEYNINVVGV